MKKRMDTVVLSLNYLLSTGKAAAFSVFLKGKIIVNSIKFKYYLVVELVIRKWT